MPTYISLIRFTQKGVETIREGAKRLDMAKHASRDAGAELKAFYLGTGQYNAAGFSLQWIGRRAAIRPSGNAF